MNAAVTGVISIQGTSEAARQAGLAAATGAGRGAIGSIAALVSRCDLRRQIARLVNGEAGRWQSSLDRSCHAGSLASGADVVLALSDPMAGRGRRSSQSSRLETRDYVLLDPCADVRSSVTCLDGDGS